MSRTTWTFYLIWARRPEESQNVCCAVYRFDRGDRVRYLLHLQGLLETERDSATSSVQHDVRAVPSGDREKASALPDLPQKLSLGEMHSRSPKRAPRGSPQTIQLQKVFFLGPGSHADSIACVLEESRAYFFRTSRRTTRTHSQTTANRHRIQFCARIAEGCDSEESLPKEATLCPRQAMRISTRFSRFPIFFGRSTPETKSARTRRFAGKAFRD